MRTISTISTFCFFFCSCFIASPDVFSQEVQSDSLKTKKGRWLQDPYNRYGFEANYSSISQHAVDVSLNTEIASTITNSFSFGFEPQYKFKLSPIFHMGLGCNFGYTIAYDYPKGFNFQIRLPEDFGNYEWGYGAHAVFLHPKFLFGGAFSVPEKGKRLRLAWEGSVGLRYSQISRDVFVRNLYKPSANVRGDRWYEKGTSFNTFSFSGGLRLNYFMGHHWDFFSQVNISAVSNQTVYALRETFDYEDGKKGGLGGVLGMQIGVSFSIDGFANFYHPCGGKFSNTHLKEINKQNQLDSAARAEGLYTGVMINDGAEVTRDPSGNVNLVIFYREAKMYMVSNKSDFSDAKWVSYDGNKPVSLVWLLPDGNEEKTVYVKFMKKDDTETEIFTDSIIQIK